MKIRIIAAIAMLFASFAVSTQAKADISNGHVNGWRISVQACNGTWDTSGLFTNGYYFLANLRDKVQDQYDGNVVRKTIIAKVNVTDAYGNTSDHTLVRSDVDCQGSGPVVVDSNYGVEQGNAPVYIWTLFLDYCGGGEIVTNFQDQYMSDAFEHTFHAWQNGTKGNYYRSTTIQETAMQTVVLSNSTDGPGKCT